MLWERLMWKEMESWITSYRCIDTSHSIRGCGFFFLSLEMCYICIGMLRYTDARHNRWIWSWVLLRREKQLFEMAGVSNLYRMEFGSVFLGFCLGYLTIFEVHSFYTCLTITANSS